MGLALPTPESVSDSSSFSERDPDEVVDEILEEVIGGSESKFAKTCKVFCPTYSV